jgi:hypothetical protein
MNVTIKFEVRPREVEEVLKRTKCIDGREFEVKKRLESVIIRCGPYDDSDLIEVKQIDGEFLVLHHGSDELPECVFSIMEEQP